MADEILPALVIDGHQKSNVLNKYRSYTYNFTLAALSTDEVNNPESYRKTELSRVILRSGGKGTAGIQVPTDLLADQVVTDTALATDRAATVEAIAESKQNIDRLTNNIGIVSGFNKNSPGQFDLFIDNVEFENIMAFSDNSGLSMPTSLKFEITEPYSISGFIEAIHVAAISAGYLSYNGASFVLKMEFIGYPDTDNVAKSKPVAIPKSTRYFIFKFTNIEIDVTEQGTRYRCDAIPWNEAGFGEPNKLKKPIQIAGNTVKDILEHLMTQLTLQVANDDKNSKTVPDGEHDEYMITFPSRTDTGFDYTVPNKISKSNISDLQKNNRTYELIDPIDSTNDAYNGPSSAANTEKIKYNPIGKASVQFAAGAAIHDCISAIIRDSEFGSGIAKSIGDPSGLGKIDEYGFIEYFLIKMEVTNILGNDKTRRKAFQRYTYVVTPYRVHRSVFPTHVADNVSVAALKRDISLREYNYLYTGQNVDILKFKINFNTLFFEAVPYAMGTNDRLRNIDTVSADGIPKEQESRSDPASVNDSTGVTSQRTVARAGEIMPIGGTGDAPQTDPYTVLARNMHQAIVNSKVGMIQGELEIIGDPFFLVTSGNGNYDPKLTNIAMTADNESAYTHGEVYITVNFRNPIDISTFENGGQLYFAKEKIAFSGVYKVTQVRSMFKSGSFTQRLEVIRLPGQIFDNTPETDAASRTKSSEDAANTPVSGINPIAGFRIMPTLPISNFGGATVSNIVNNQIAETAGAVAKFNPLSNISSAATTSPLLPVYKLTSENK